MAFFKDTATGTTPAPPTRDVLRSDPERPAVPEPARRPVTHLDARAAATAEKQESFIGSDVTIEGKIEGGGHVRIAGRFKGDVLVQGNLTIDAGAQLTGQVTAKQVIISGELQGNIEGAERVELLDHGVLVGDVKAGSLTVAAGSRMRGKVEFGWTDKPSIVKEPSRGTGSGA